MQSRKDKFVNQILVGSMAFSLSFGLGLILNRDFQQAVFTGIATIPASYGGAIALHRRRIQQEKRLKQGLRNQIQALMAQREDCRQELTVVLTEQQHLMGHLQSLYSEREQLLLRVAELHQYRNELSQELARVAHQQKALKGKNPVTQPQLQAAQTETVDLDRGGVAYAVLVEKAEDRLEQLQTEYDFLQRQILEHHQQREQILPELAQLSTKKQQLSGDLKELQNHIQQLETFQEQLNQALADLELQREYTDEQIFHRQAKLEGLELEIENLEQAWKEKQKNIQKLDQKTLELSRIEQEIEQLQQQKQALQAELATLQQKTQPDISTAQPSHKVAPVAPSLSPAGQTLPEEWLNFVAQLDSLEKQALKAILEQDEESLKQLADQAATMPEVVVDALNEKALNTIGDTFLIRQDLTVSPTLDEEYLTLFIHPLMIQFKDLLGLTP